MSWAAERASRAELWAKIRSSKKTIRRTPFIRRNRTQLPITVVKTHGAVDSPKGRTAKK
jgi:hypothetical protein